MKSFRLGTVDCSYGHADCGSKVLHHEIERLAERAFVVGLKGEEVHAPARASVADQERRKS